MADLAEAVAGRAAVLEIRADVASRAARELIRRAVKAQARAAVWREFEAAAEAAEDAAVARAQITLGEQS